MAFNDFSITYTKAQRLTAQPPGLIPGDERQGLCSTAELHSGSEFPGGGVSLTTKGSCGQGPDQQRLIVVDSQRFSF